MLKPTGGVISERPNRPLVVRCAYEGLSRRVNFPSAATCRLKSLRSRVEECFSLSASPFSLTYTDDDGEVFTIHSESDFTEAISYFISGDDEAAVSNYSGGAGGTNGSASMSYAFSHHQRISVRLDVVVEYDGPSLSDTSSISSFQTGSSSGSDSEKDGTSWRSSSAYGYEDNDSGHVARYFPTLHEDVEDDGLTQYGEGSRSRGPLTDALRAMNLEDPLGPQIPSAQFPGSAAGSGTPRQRSDQLTAYDVHCTPSPPPAHPPILTGPESETAPSLLTHSELGSRWLREQSRLAARKLGPSPRAGVRSARYDSDEESFASDEDRPGDIALVQDARGRYYYSYQTDASSSHSEAAYTDRGLRVRPLSAHVSSASSTSSTSSPATPPVAVQSEEMVRISEPTGPPILAPGCSACGIRLDYMRYVCRTCGEGKIWKENAPDKAAFIHPKKPDDGDFSDGSSEVTESNLPRAASSGSGPGSSGSQTVYNLANARARSESMSTNASRGSWQVAADAAPSPTSATNRNGSGPTPPHSRRASFDGQPDVMTLAQHRGYELCPECIEVHGITHSRAAARAARHELNSLEVQRRRDIGELRHTFREKIWGAGVWVDVEYTDDSECSICRSALSQNRYKCVTCPKFDLCQTCYHKVEEIHPSHAFLSLPTKAHPQVGPSSLNGVRETNGRAARDLTAPQPVRHPGAFCHNCLQDIVGPRFHCAVCPSWDLCIQCEGVYMAGGDGSGHLADHIMMKIPLPLPSSEVEAVSRRARDRWFQQDRTVAVGRRSTGNDATSSRSSSPTNETVYAPTATASRHSGPAPNVPPSQVVYVTTRDALDHGVRCGNCREWIMGRRYQCANCPSDPEGYNLCSICELRSYRFHNPSHVFLKFDRPVHVSLSSPRPLFPILYKHPVGKVPSSALTTIDPRDPTSYLRHVMHRETVCDLHGDQIRGVWLRCAHCAAGFDICHEAERIANHDPTHVFVVFKARVDMAVFRSVADLAATHSKPLLKQQVYVS
ncbi:hypothetical protein IAR55_007101 [Kwoniella newhampshirensis]|uniref:ZZ-type domain-containing protein n=1 Tax=Kwoniella newhampshirensis TaxID=1651941 RepID=A0AAW0YHR4_9TREE